MEQSHAFDVSTQHEPPQHQGQHKAGCCMQESGTWEGYLVAAAASKQTLGSGSVAQDLLRKRYLGISGSNKVVGALEIQQASLQAAADGKHCEAAAASAALH